MSEKVKKGGNSFKIIIIVLLVLIIVGGGAFAGFYFLGNKNEVATTTKPKVVQTNEVTYSLDECTLNLTNEDGFLYLKVLVFIGYEDNADLAAELETKKPIIRDTVIASLRAKKDTDFTTKGVELIKTELIARINPLLSKGKISHVYINDIVISR
ncbi:flagellar basal body-associated FliL family protein [Clostridium lacusfryxellense]|uniref:flagellar basal body-associated FliL family protein n=1 Tax=Clostridium lacusfryxellense TaxID=205328 RepID=UPI001C0B35F1|nr:flagellar basal body-associated FliL family protein [Clostridium lacusfryxellense]MBU3111792.1 flagellar basal body-associated FliL family protein [Clostridium lacusfryxellense]